MYKHKYYKYKKKYNDLKMEKDIDANMDMMIIDNTYMDILKNVNRNVNRNVNIDVNRNINRIVPETNMSYTNRIEYYNKLNDKIKDNSDCLTLARLQTQLTNKNTFITTGGHSTIYKKTVNIDNDSIDIAIKEQAEDKMVNKKHIVWVEYGVLKKCNELVLKKVTQNLPLIYDMNICKNDNKIIFYNELASGDFIDWLYDDHSEDEWMSFLFQFWCGLYVLQKHVKLVHNDLRLGNVLYHKINKDKVNINKDKVNINKEYWKYTIDGIDYFIPNEGYVFIIWDFGSSDLIDSNTSQDVRYNKLKANIDLHFFHDLYNRIRVLILMDKYSLSELESFFKTSDEVYYLKGKKNECEMKFRKYGRYDEKCKIAMIYYLIENNRFDELNKKSVNKDIDKIVKLPPLKIMKLLKELSDNNYDYNDVLKMIYNPKYQIRQTLQSPNTLIAKYFNEYKNEQPTILQFTI